MSASLVSRFMLDRSRQVAPQIFDFLRECIVSVQIAPGTVMSRAELQSQFGVSQTPVREALLKLEEEGLVRVYPQHATLVSRINISQARQAHFMRRAVEANIAFSLARNATEILVKELNHANDLVRTAAQAGDLTSFLVADRGFHKIMYQHSDMMMIWGIMRANSGHLDRLRRLNLPKLGVQRIVREHENLISAIEQKKPQQAAEAMQAHLANTLAMLDEVANEYPEFIER